MKIDDNTLVGHRTLLTNMGVVAAAGLTAGAGPASALNPGQFAGFQPSRHNRDAWLDECEYPNYA